MDSEVEFIMEIPPISPLRPGTLFRPEAPQSRPARPEKTSSTKNRDSLKGYIEFWKNELMNWTPPSEFVTNVKQVLCLWNIRDLGKDDAVDGLQKLFQGNVDYRVDTVEIPTEPTMYIAWCKWPGRIGWISEEGLSEPVAMTNVSVKALKTVLGNRFEKYCKILALKNYTGKTEEELDEIFRSEVLKEGSSCPYRSEAASVSESQEKAEEQLKESSSAGRGYFDESPLTWTEKRWRKLSKVEMEDALFRFWNQTSHGQKFPWTMNLFWVRYPISVEATAAFVLLFSDGRKLRKPGLSWIDLKPQGNGTPKYRVKLIWTDENEKTHRVGGSDSTLILARNDAAKAAMKKIFSKTDLKILKHAHSSAVYDGIKRNGIDLQTLWDKLVEAKKSKVSNTNVNEDAVNSSGRSRWIPIHSRPQQPPSTVTSAHAQDVLRTPAPEAPHLAAASAEFSGVNCCTPTPLATAASESNSTSNTVTRPPISIPIMQGRRPRTLLPKPTMFNDLQTPTRVGATSPSTPEPPEPRPLLSSSTVSNSSLPVALASIVRIITTPTLSAPTVRLPPATPSLTPSQSNQSTPTAKISPTAPQSLSQASVLDLTAQSDTHVDAQSNESDRGPTPLSHESSNPAVTGLSSVASTNQSALPTPASPTAPPSPFQTSVPVLTAQPDTTTQLGEPEPDATPVLPDESPNATAEVSSSVASTNQSAFATPPSPTPLTLEPENCVPVLTAQRDTSTEPDEPDGPPSFTLEASSVFSEHQSAPVDPTIQTPLSPPQFSAPVLTAQNDTSTYPGELDAASLPNNSPNPPPKTSTLVASTNPSVLATATSPAAPPSPPQVCAPVLVAESNSSVRPNEPDASPSSTLSDSSVTSTQKPNPAIQTPPTAAPPTPQSSVPLLTAPSDMPTQPVEPNLDEYFSTSDDGSVAVSDWLSEYLKTAHTRSMDQYRYSEEKDDPSQRTERHFLPFHKIIGYEYPQEASLALDEIFEDGKEPSPIFATTKLVLAEVEVNDKTFQGLGATMEEAKETAAKAMLKFLQSQSSAVPDEVIVLSD